MKNSTTKQYGPFDFIDRLMDLFHHPSQNDPPPSTPQKNIMNKDFETALLALEQTIEQQHERDLDEKGSWKRSLKIEKEEAKKAREKKNHEQIRHDIELAHERLQTEISPQELDLLRDYLLNATHISTVGENSHEVLPRCRFAILRRIHYEAGLLALNELDKHLAEHNESWPAIVPRDPTLSEEEAQEILKQNQATRRQNFLDYNIQRSSSLIVGVVDAWKSDYPEVGSALWKSVVIEAVATAFRAKLMHRFSSKLRQDRSLVEKKASELIGAKV